MLANIGVPMLFVQYPALIVALPIVIIIEAMCCRRWFDLTWNSALKAAGAANVKSTLIGFPVMWVVLVVIQFSTQWAMGRGGAPDIPEPWFSVYTVTFQAAWLYPFSQRLYWMIPTAFLVLLVPAFFMTIWIERKVYQRRIGSLTSRMSVGEANVRMHLASYAFLVIVAVGVLVYSVIDHDNKHDRDPSTDAEIKWGV